MSEWKDLLYIIKTYTKERNIPIINIIDLQRLAEKWSANIRKKRPEFTDFSDYSTKKLETILDNLVSEKYCSIDKSNGNLVNITSLDFYRESIRKKYAEIELDIEKPFPNETSFRVALQKNLLKDIDIESDFINTLKLPKKEISQFLYINFPDGIKSIIVSSELLDSVLLKLSISKFRLYLSIKRNQIFIFHKMQASFQHEDHLIKDMLSKLMKQEPLVIETIMNPNDFTFHFWSHFSFLLINEFKKKTEKLEQEHSFSQAAYIIGYYNIYFKKKEQKKSAEKLSFKMIKEGFKKSPFIFSFTDIMEFKDKNGFPLSKYMVKAALLKYLDKRTTPKSEQILPDILKFEISPNNYMFIHKKEYLSLTLHKIQKDSRKLRNQYIDDWKDIIGTFKHTKIMTRQDLFIEDLTRRVMKLDPLLMVLMKFNYLQVSLKETTPSEEIYIETERLFNSTQNGLKPLDKIFRLDRKALYSDAKLKLPIWKAFPLIYFLIFFKKRLFSGIKKNIEKIKDPSDLARLLTKTQNIRPAVITQKKKILKNKAVKTYKKATIKPALNRYRTKTKLMKYREAVKKIEKQFIGEKESLNEEIASSIDTWVPLLMDGKGKKALVEDINSMIRDYLRGMKKSFAYKPPDASRIKHFAEHLSSNSAFKKINRKNEFKRYMELYIIKILSQK